MNLPRPFPHEDGTHAEASIRNDARQIIEDARDPFFATFEQSRESAPNAAFRLGHNCPCTTVASSYRKGEIPRSECSGINPKY